MCTAKVMIGAAAVFFCFAVDFSMGSLVRVPAVTKSAGIFLGKRTMEIKCMGKHLAKKS